MRVTIASELLDRVIALAAAEPGREVCGLLLGVPDKVLAVVPTANVAADPVDSFEIDPAALLTAHRAVRGGGLPVVGHYHSHPRGSCAPSPRDLAAAVPGQLWLIVAGGGAALFRAGSDGGFVRCMMINAPAAGCGSAAQSPQGRRRDRRQYGQGQGHE